MLSNHISFRDGEFRPIPLDDIQAFIDVIDASKRYTSLEALLSLGISVSDEEVEKDDRYVGETTLEDIFVGEFSRPGMRDIMVHLVLEGMRAERGMGMRLGWDRALERVCIDFFVFSASFPSSQDCEKRRIVQDMLYSPLGQP